jgi:hypothetical protein
VPNEILLIIFRYVSPTYWGNILSTSKQWSNILAQYCDSVRDLCLTTQPLAKWYNNLRIITYDESYLIPLIDVINVHTLIIIGVCDVFYSTHRLQQWKVQHIIFLPNACGIIQQYLGYATIRDLVSITFKYGWLSNPFYRYYPCHFGSINTINFVEVYMCNTIASFTIDLRTHFAINSGLCFADYYMVQ